MIVFSLLVILVTFIYIYLRFTYSFWERIGFPNIKPIIPIGNLADVMTGRTSFGINMSNLYKASTDPLVGIYLFFRPALIIRDADLVKEVLVTNFSSFHDRGVYYNPDHDPLSGHLFCMPGKTWKNLRAKLTPTFTSGKLKAMLSTIIKEGEHLQQYLQPLADREEELATKDIVDRFALNIISSAGFGLEINTIENPKHEFRAIEHKINSPDFLNVLRVVGAFLCPKILKFLNLGSTSPEVVDFFVDMVKRTIEHREQNNIIRKDFMQLLIQLRNSGKVSKDGDWDIQKSADEMKSLSIGECAAQTFLFYIAGFDTSSSAIVYCLHELTHNKEAFDKVKIEIAETLERHNGELTYECIQEMTYLENCILETVRKHPSLPLLNRECTEDYEIKKLNLTIPKGTPIIISIFALGRDPAYFPNPEEFIPERYEEGNMNYVPNAFIPFGDGPRACIGLRLGKLIAKIGMVQLLEKFDFEATQPRDVDYENFAITLVPKGGLKMKIKNK